MKIDSHHHLWRYRSQDFSWMGDSLAMLKRDFLAEEFEGELASAGIEGSVVVQSFHSLEETRWLLEVADNSPFVLGVVGWVDLESSAAADDLDGLVSPSLVGVRHIVKSEPSGFLARPAFRRGLGLLAPRNLAFDLLILPPQLPEAIELVEAFPLQTFVLNHLANPKTPGVSWRIWRRDLARLATSPKVFAKLSGLVSETYPSMWDPHEIRDLLATAYELFGEDRLLLSSNWPVGNLAGSYSWTMGWSLNFVASLSAAAQQKILGDNAVRAYGLKPKGPPSNDHKTDTRSESSPGFS